MPSKKEYDNVRVLRVIAVCGIFTGHFFQRIGATGWLQRIAVKGSLCVELFFVISGFLAMLAFYQKPVTIHSVLSYYKRRAIRILPLYYFVIACFFVTETFIFCDVPADPTRLGWARYLFLLSQNIRSGDGWFDFWTNLGATWTVMVFATFYFFMPLFGKLIRKFSHALVFSVFWYLVRAFMEWKDFAFLHTFQYFVFFSLGMLAFIAVKENKQNLFYLFIGAALVFSILFSGTFLQFNDLMTAAICSAIVVVASADYQLKNDRVKKLIAVLDQYSYTIYLGQGIIFCGIIDKAPGLNKPYAAFISIFGTAAVTLFCYHCVERPIQKALGKLGNSA